MEKETLRVTWKIIRRKGYGRTPVTYCTYIAENKKHKHRLKTVGDTELFKLLETTRVTSHPKYADSPSIYVDIVYNNGKVISITNPRKV